MTGGKKKALSVVFSCAERYKTELVNRSLLFVCTDKHGCVHCVEVTFDASNFKHMTGLQTSLDAGHFFSLCLDRRLSESDFEFAKDGTTRLKLDVLPQLVKKDLSANMLGDYNGSHVKLQTDKLAGGVCSCIGFVRAEGSGRYVPNTVLKGDIRDKARNLCRIVATYRKARGEERYSEIVRCAKGVDWGRLKLPEEYAYLPLPRDLSKAAPGAQ